MDETSVKDEIRLLLEPDLLRHIATLKALARHPSVQTKLIHRADEWALLTMRPTSASNWDNVNYPSSKAVAFIDGNNVEYKIALLDEVPMESTVIKTYDEKIISYLKSRGVKKATAFISFTDPGHTKFTEMDEKVEKSSQLKPEIGGLLAQGGYSSEELSWHFSKGASWFGVRIDGRVASACFVYQNYLNVWEIGGLYTDSEHRRLGLARLNVSAAIQYLRGKNKTIRFQVSEGNEASRQLARSAGLLEFLRICHLHYDACQ